LQDWVIETVAFSFQEREIFLDVSLAASAAKKYLVANLPMADAIVYATARSHQAGLVTSDAHFSGLPGVRLIECQTVPGFDLPAIRLALLDRVEHRR